MVVANRQAGRCALLRRLEQVVYAIAVDFEVFQRDLNLCSAIGVFLDLLASSIDSAQESGDYTTIGQRFPSSHRMRLASAGAAMRKDRKVEAIKQVLDRW